MSGSWNYLPWGPQKQSRPKGPNNLCSATGHSEFVISYNPAAVVIAVDHWRSLKIINEHDENTKRDMLIKIDVYAILFGPELMLSFLGSFYDSMRDSNGGGSIHLIG